ncbi:MAG: hypothetical protein PVJ71_03760 [Lysobacterales bacterium]|jgi:hypothetical protein
MRNDMSSQDLQARRKKAVRTAIILGLVALAIFAAFVGSAVLGH